MVEFGGAARSRSTDMEAGTAGVPELEVEEVSVLGIASGLRELMKVEVSVDFSGSRCIARLRSTS